MPPKKKPADDPNKPVDDESEESEALDADRINSIITKRLNRAFEKFDERIGAVVGEVLKPHLEKITAASQQGEGGAKGSEGGAAKGTGNDAVDARLKAIEEQNAKLAEQLKSEREGRKSD